MKKPLAWNHAEPGAVQPDVRELAPPPKFGDYPLHARIAAWVVWSFAIWGFISMVGCVFSASHAGTCRHYSDGPDSVTACEDGSVIERHQDGRVDRYGTPNTPEFALVEAIAQTALASFVR